MGLTSLISISVKDDAGNSDTMRVFVPATATLAQVEALVAFIAPLVDAVSGGVITGASVSLAVDLPVGLKAVAVADSLKQVGANFSYSADNTIYRHTIRIPAINPSKYSGGALLVGDADVIALANGFVNGTADLDPTDEYANDLNGPISQELSFRRK